MELTEEDLEASFAISGYVLVFVRETYVLTLDQQRSLSLCPSVVAITLKSRKVRVAL